MDSSISCEIQNSPKSNENKVDICIPKEKGSKSKRQISQDQFLECLKNISETAKLKPDVKALVNKLTLFRNVPRKEKKLKSFARNCLHVKSPELLFRLWNVVSSASNKLKTTKESSVSPKKTKTNKLKGQKSQKRLNASVSKNKWNSKVKQSVIEKTVAKNNLNSDSFCFCFDVNESKNNEGENSEEAENSGETENNEEAENSGETENNEEAENSKKAKKMKLMEPENKPKIKETKQDLDKKPEKSKISFIKKMIEFLQESENQKMSFMTLKQKMAQHCQSNGIKMNGAKLKLILKRQIAICSKLRLEGNVVKLLTNKPDTRNLGRRKIKAEKISEEKNTLYWENMIIDVLQKSANQEMDFITLKKTIRELHDSQSDEKGIKDYILKRILKHKIYSCKKLQQIENIVKLENSDVAGE